MYQQIYRSNNPKYDKAMGRTFSDFHTLNWDNIAQIYLIITSFEPTIIVCGIV